MSPRCIALLALLAALLLPARARADEEDQRAILTLVVNHAERHEAAVVLRGRDVLVAPEDLRKAGLVGISGREETVSGRRLVSLVSLSRTLVFSVDEGALALRID